MRTGTKKARFSSGFSLVEVTVALGIVGVGLLSVIALLAQGIDAASTSKLDSQSAQVARRIIGDLRLGGLSMDSSYGAAGTEAKRVFEDHLPLSIAGGHAPIHLGFDQSQNQVFDGDIGGGDTVDGFFASGDPTGFLATFASVAISTPILINGQSFNEVSVTVGSPAAAPHDRRTTSHYVFHLKTPAP